MPRQQRGRRARPDPRRGLEPREHDERAQLDFVNQAGGRNSVKVSILEKDKLMQLAQNIQRLVFADVEGQRHQESMDMAQKQYTAQTNSVLIQQQMLDQQRKATADDNPSMPTE